MTLDESTTIDLVQDEGNAMPAGPHLEIKKISEIETTDAEDTVDVVGVLIGVGELGSITKKKDGMPLAKREITLLDDSNACINCTLWGDDAEGAVPDAEMNAAKNGYMNNERPCVIVLKAGRVSDFQGRGLSKSFASQLLVNAEIPQADALRYWYTNSYKMSGVPAKSLSGQGGGGAATPYLTIQEMQSLKDDPLKQDQLDGKGYWYYLRCVILKTHINEGRYFWQACAECGRKVQDAAGDSYSMGGDEKFCTNCNKNVKSGKKWICRITIADTTGQENVAAFGDKVIPILHMTCDTAYGLEQSGSECGRTGMCFEDVTLYPQGKTYIIKMCSRYKVWQDERRVEHSVFEAKEQIGLPAMNDACARLTGFLGSAM